MLVSHVLPKKLPNLEHFPHWRQLWWGLKGNRAALRETCCSSSIFFLQRLWKSSVLWTKLAPEKLCFIVCFSIFHSWGHCSSYIPAPNPICLHQVCAVLERGGWSGGPGHHRQGEQHADRHLRREDDHVRAVRQRDRPLSGGSPGNSLIWPSQL